MHKIDQLANQHIREHQSRLLHIDELIRRVDEGLTKTKPQSEVEMQLSELRADREKLSKHIEELKRKSIEEWQVAEIEQVGPLIIWDAVAKKLEHPLERVGH